MPYINGRLWDRDIPSFAEEGFYGAAKDRKGRPYDEAYYSGAALAVMCPSKIWGDRIYELADGLFNEHGVDGIYLDQIGAHGPVRCFDRSHGHRLGGGDWWAGGYRTLLQRVRDLGERSGKKIFLTTENPIECFMDTIDAHLRFGTRDMPGLNAVYSGYTLHFNSGSGVAAGPEKFKGGEAHACLDGIQIGWGNANDGTLKHPDLTKYMGAIGRLRKRSVPFLVEGEYVDELSCDLPTPQKTLRATVWKAPDGRLGVLMANLTATPRVFSNVIRPGTYGLGAGPWLITRSSADEEHPAGFAPGPQVRRIEWLAPHEIRLLIFEPVEDALVAMSRWSRSAAAIGHPIQAGRTSEELLAAAAQWVQIRTNVTEPLRGCLDDLLADVVLAVISTSVQTMAPPTVMAAASVEGRLVLHRKRFCGHALSYRARLSDGDPIAGRLPGEGQRQHKIVLDAGKAVDGFVSASVDLELRVDDAMVRRRLALATRILEPLEARLEMPGAINLGHTTFLTVDVRSNAAGPQRPVVTVEAPQSWQIHPGRSVHLGAMAPGVSRRLELKCHVPMDSKAGEHSVKVFVDGQPVAEQLVDVRQAPPQLVGHRFITPPTIDGDLNEWQSRPFAWLSPAHFGNKEDISSKSWFGWDEDYFYFATEVTDDVHNQRSVGHGLWGFDCMQMGLRPGPLSKNDSYDVATREFGFALTPKGPYMHQWYPENEPVDEAPISVVRRGTKTNYEVAIPWRRISPDFLPAPGAPLTGTFSVNENDGAKLLGWIQWVDKSVVGGKDPTRYGYFVLEDVPPDHADGGQDRQ